MHDLTPEQWAHAIPIDQQPDYYKRPTQLCGEITIWTRGKQDEECVVALQEQANKLAEKTEKMSLLNVESDTHLQVGIEANDLRKKFEQVRRMLLEDKLRFIHEFATEELKQNSNQLQTALKTLLQNKGEWPEWTHEETDYFSPLVLEKNFQNILEFTTFRDAFDAYIAKHKVMKNRSLQSDFLRMIESGEYYYWSRNMLARLGKSTIDYSQMEKAVNPVFEQFQRKYTPIEKTQKPVSDSHYQKVCERAKKWFEGVQTDGANFIYVHEFISEEERKESNIEQGGSDYSDHLLLTIKARKTEQGLKFDIFGSETLGVATFVRSKMMRAEFRLQRFFENYFGQREGVKEMTETDKIIWNDYHHVDKECRMIQGKIKGLSKEETQKLFFELILFLQQEGS